MAEAIVSIVLDQLVSLALKQIEEEASLVTGVDKEVENLILHFSAIQGVLQDAEERQVAEANVRNWVANLEDLSYQINDVLDEWNTKILKHQQMIEDSKGDDFVHTKWTSKVSFLISSARICFGKVDQLVMRRDIAKRIREINEKLTIVATVRQSYQFQITKRGARPITSSFVEVSHIIGREKEKQDTINMLFGESSSTNTSTTQQEGQYVISILGMGGLGKTAFAQSIYEDERVKSHFNQRIWVCVSDPFNNVKIAKEIAQAIKTDGQTNLDNLQSCLVCVSNNTCGKKFLLVLDDVWTPTMDQWEPILKALQTSDIGSRILVTTRKETAGVTMGATRERMVRLDKLSKKKSLELFRRTALFNQMDDKSRFFDEGMMNQIVEKCDGLPLAIKTLASIMRYKKTKEEWIDVLDSKMWELGEVEEQIFQPLLLSYYDLTPVVRRCLLYCAIFPKDSVLKKEKLIEYWMHQGCLGITGDNKKEAIIGQTYFDNLVMRSFFQDTSKDDNENIVSCKMHDIVHDFVQFLVKNEFVIMEVDRDNKSKFVMGNKVRHLNIKGCSFDSFAESIYKCKRLRTLLASRSNISKLSSNLILQWKCLRTLKLGGNGLKELPKEIGELVHLRYLHLNGNMGLIELPDTVGNLYNLETLNLKLCSSLKTLPVTVRKLTHLKHLRVILCINLKLPKEVGRLYNLQTLDGAIPSNASNHKQFKLGDFRKLDQLRGSLWIKFLKSEKDVGEAKAAQLANKKYLSELFLEFDREDERNNIDQEILEALQPPTNLESLRIRCYGGTTLCPSWMTSLSCLKTVYVDDFPFCAGLGPLGKLPSLESLTIAEMPEWEEWVGVEGERESDVSQVTTIMPSLSTLQIRECPRLKSLPDFLWNTPLKNLDIEDCPITLFVRLGKLPSLESLTVREINGLKTLGAEFLGKESEMKISFPNLKKIKFVDMPEWEEWEEWVGVEGERESDVSHVTTIMPSLSILRIENCPRLKSLPDFLGKTPLKQLKIDRCDALKLPKGVGRLYSLQTLEDAGIIPSNARNHKQFTLGDLRKLDQLRGRLSIKFFRSEKDVGEAKAAQLANKKYLSQLDLYFDREENERNNIDEEILEALQPPTNLESLRIRCYGGTTLCPPWMTSLSNLKAVEVSGYPLCAGLAAPLGKLPSLERLSVWSMNGLKTLGAEFLGKESEMEISFPKLNYIEFYSMPEWEEWEEWVGVEGERESDVSQVTTIMPSLSTLEIGDCPRLKSLPDFLWKTPLKNLSFGGCPSNLLYGRLGKLPSLETLTVRRMNGLKTLGVEFLGKESEMEISSFPKLNKIYFVSMLEWEEWVGVEGERESDVSQVTTIMPSLSSLRMCECPRLKSLPDFLWKTPLNNLEIGGCPNTLRGCESRSGPEWDKVSRIPNIRINGTYVQREDQ